MFLYIFKSFHCNIITCHSCLTTGNYLLRIYACVYVILASKINEVTAPAMVQISELFVCNQQIVRTISCMSRKLRTDIKKLAKIYNLQFIIFPDNPGQKSLGHHNVFLCFYYWLEIDSILCKITLSTPPLPSPIQCWSWSDAHATFLINFQHWTGWGWGGGLWIKLTSLNVQVSQHFWPG